MCNLASKCKNDSKFIVIHKAVGAMPERKVEACERCAGKIMGGKVLNSESRDSRFYKIESK